MTKSDSRNSQPEQPYAKPESSTVRINNRTSRRKSTLILITLLLNALFWSALICLGTSLYQIVSDPSDTTNIIPVILNLTSALATIAYTCVHTVFSFKRRIWEQRRHTSVVRNTSYIAIRLVISLCVLWLLTSGWNMVLVARRPICLQQAPSLQSWESGSTCLCGRIGTTFAAISLIASFVLFGVLAVVNRPFEAHLFKHGYQKPTNAWLPPHSSDGSSITEDRKCTCEKYAYSRHVTPTRRSSSSNPMEQSRRSSSGSRVFTSHHAPPPIPSAFIASYRKSSFDTLPSASQPSVNRGALDRPPLSLHSASKSGFEPLFTQAQYSASAWRAIHPEGSDSTLNASRPRPYSRDYDLRQSIRYSHSSVSLTRPSRLSSLSTVSRSCSDGSNSRDHTFGVTDRGERASPDEIAFAITKGTPIPGTERVRSLDRHHIRTASAPDYTSPSQQKPGCVFDAIVVTRKPVPVRRLRSADRVRASSTSNSEAERFMVSQRLGNFQHPNHRSEYTELGMSRRMTFEEVKNKPLPKIAVF